MPMRRTRANTLPKNPTSHQLEPLKGRQDRLATGARPTQMQRRPRGHPHLPPGLYRSRPLPGVPPALRDPVPARHTRGLHGRQARLRNDGQGPGAGRESVPLWAEQAVLSGGRAGAPGGGARHEADGRNRAAAGAVAGRARAQKLPEEDPAGERHAHHSIKLNINKF